MALMPQYSLSFLPGTTKCDTAYSISRSGELPEMRVNVRFEGGSRVDVRFFPEGHSLLKAFRGLRQLIIQSIKIVKIGEGIFVLLLVIGGL